MIRGMLSAYSKRKRYLLYGNSTGEHNFESTTSNQKWPFNNSFDLSLLIIIVFVST